VTKFSVDRGMEDKRQLFIDAAIHSLAEHGYKATTVRQIAKIAGVTPGLLTHYFSGKEVLIAQSYEYLAKKFLDIFEARIRGKEDEPVEALRTFIFATFDTENLDPKLLKVWLSFWSLTLTQPDLRHIHKATYRRYVDVLQSMIAAAYKMEGRVVEPRRMRAYAIGINALLDGMWLEWCLDPDTFTPKEGLEIIYDFVESTTGLVLR